jgi:two-component system chemotaxis response regulator CheY
MKVLIVDDSATMRKILSNTVAPLEAEADEAADGNQALELLRQAPVAYDVALLDWNMPELSGFDTLKTIKDDPALAPLPAIMVTTEAERAQMVNALQAGACQYVVKPFEADALQQKIRTVVSSA